MIFGHVAVSALLHRYLKADLVPVMAAAAMPDVVDKVAHYVFLQGEGSRWMGHTLVSIAASTALIWTIWGKKAAWSWGLGYLLHLLGEFGGVVPWFFPFKTYEFPPDLGFGETLSQSLTNLPRMVLETVLVLWAAVAMLNLWVVKERRVEKAYAMWKTRRRKT